MVLSSSLARFPNLANSGVKIIIGFTIKSHVFGTKLSDLQTAWSIRHPSETQHIIILTAFGLLGFAILSLKQY